MIVIHGFLITNLVELWWKYLSKDAPWRTQDANDILNAMGYVFQRPYDKSISLYPLIPLPLVLQITSLHCVLIYLDNCSSPGQPQAIVSTKDDFLSITPQEKDFNDTISINNLL